jgi:DNA-binding NarL/FixJ family response regulator
MSKRRAGPDADVPDEQTLAILAQLAAGKSLKDAATACFVSRRTLIRKLVDVRELWSVETNIQAVVEAVRRGLI